MFRATQFAKVADSDTIVSGVYQLQKDAATKSNERAMKLVHALDDMFMHFVPYLSLPQLASLKLDMERTRTRGLKDGRGEMTFVSVAKIRVVVIDGGERTFMSVVWIRFRYE